MRAQAAHIATRYHRKRDGTVFPVEITATALPLGLYITKGLVEAHGGRIWVKSEAGSG